MCSSRKYSYPPKGRLIEILTSGRGVQKSNFSKESMALNMEFPEG